MAAPFPTYEGPPVMSTQLARGPDSEAYVRLGGSVLTVSLPSAMLVPSRLRGPRRADTAWLCGERSSGADSFRRNRPGPPRDAPVIVPKLTGIRLPHRSEIPRGLGYNRSLAVKTMICRAGGRPNGIGLSGRRPSY